MTDHSLYGVVFQRELMHAVEGIEGYPIRADVGAKLLESLKGALTATDVKKLIALAYLDTQLTRIHKACDLGVVKDLCRVLPRPVDPRISVASIKERAGERRLYSRIDS